MRRGALVALMFAVSVPASAAVLETRVAWAPQCPSQQAGPPGARAAVLAAVAAIIAPKLVEGLVDYASLALTQAAADKADTSTAFVDSSFYTVSMFGDLERNGVVQCLIVVKGEFDSRASGPSPLPDHFPDLRALYFRAEMDIVPLPGLRFFQLRPVYLKSLKPETSSIFSGAERDYVVSVTMKAPGATDSFASAAISIPRVLPGTQGERLKPALIAFTSEPMPFPAALADANAAKTKQEQAAARYVSAMAVLESQKAGLSASDRPDDYVNAAVLTALNAVCDDVISRNRTLPKEHQQFDDRCLGPLQAKGKELDRKLAEAFTDKPSVDWARNVCPGYVAGADGSLCGAAGFKHLSNKAYGFFRTSVTLTETRKGSQWAKLFAQAVAASKDDLKTYAKSKLPAEQSRLAALQDETERQTLRGMLHADLGVEKAEAALAEALSIPGAKQSEIIAARIAVLNAKIASNDAYRKAGLTLPYPEAR